jgi:GNAT superfamily N-acetyltransferase
MSTAEEASAAIEIRMANREDLPAIVQLLLRDAIPSPPPQDGPADGQIKAFAEIVANPDNEIVVATLGSEVVGTLQITYIPGISHNGAWLAQVEAVRVREDLRSQRIGTRLMEWVIARARERGCRTVQLTSNRLRLDAHRFYERLGFATSHVGMKLYL